MNPGTWVVAEYGRRVPPDLTQLGYNPRGSSFCGITGGTLVNMRGGGRTGSHCRLWKSRGELYLSRHPAPAYFGVEVKSSKPHL